MHFHSLSQQARGSLAFHRWYSRERAPRALQPSSSLLHPAKAATKASAVHAWLHLREAATAKATLLHLTEATAAKVALLHLAKAATAHASLHPTKAATIHAWLHLATKAIPEAATEAVSEAAVDTLLHLSKATTVHTQLHLTEVATIDAVLQLTKTTKLLTAAAQARRSRRRALTAMCRCWRRVLSTTCWCWRWAVGDSSDTRSSSCARHTTTRDNTAANRNSGHDRRLNDWEWDGHGDWQHLVVVAAAMMVVVAIALLFVSFFAFEHLVGPESCSRGLVGQR
jgi:hypothetical protein